MVQEGNLLQLPYWPRQTQVKELRIFQEYVTLESLS